MKKPLSRFSPFNREHGMQVPHSRRRFLEIIALTSTGALMSSLAQSSAPLQPETFQFKDDGAIPNNKLPLLLYRGAFPADTPDLASAIERRYAKNNWSGTWRAGVFPFHHYHSTTHEALTVYSGTATLQLGGEQGRKFDVKVGDMIIIPAGVGHKRLSSDPDFGVVGSYPEGRRWDLLRGEPGERPKADRNIAAVPMPKDDPLQGPDGPLIQIWKAVP